MTYSCTITVVEAMLTYLIKVYYYYDQYKAIYN